VIQGVDYGKNKWAATCPPGLMPSPEWVHERLPLIYAAHAPEKLDYVGQFLSKNKGSEGMIYLCTCKKYGVHPEKWW